MTNVTQLRLTEHVQVDIDKIDALYSEMDPVQAEGVVCRAMEELAQRMAQCEKLYHAAALDELRKSSRSMVAIADQIGMPVMAKVARDVAICAEQRDHIALSATVTRLMRTGEGSLTAIWDLNNATI